MVEGAEQERWQRQSVEMALIANAHRDPKRSRPFKPSDFDPFAAAKNTEAVEFSKETAPALRRALTGK